MFACLSVFVWTFLCSHHYDDCLTAPENFWGLFEGWDYVCVCQCVWAGCLSSVPTSAAMMSCTVPSISSQLRLTACWFVKVNSLSNTLPCMYIYPQNTCSLCAKCCNDIESWQSKAKQLIAVIKSRNYYMLIWVWETHHWGVLLASWWMHHNIKGHSSNVVNVSFLCCHSAAHWQDLSHK